MKGEPIVTCECKYESEIQEMRLHMSLAAKGITSIEGSIKDINLAIGGKTGLVTTQAVQAESLRSQKKISWLLIGVVLGTAVYIIRDSLVS